GFNDEEIDAEFKNYENMEADWMSMPFGEDAECRAIAANPGLSAMISRLHDIVHPPAPPEVADKHKPCPLKLCMVGKPFAGVSTCIRQLLEHYKVTVVQPEVLVTEAVAAFNRKELESRLSLTPLSPDQTALDMPVATVTDDTVAAEHSDNQAAND